jgi:hypothetical protein
MQHPHRPTPQRKQRRDPDKRPSRREQRAKHREVARRYRLEAKHRAEENGKPRPRLPLAVVRARDLEALLIHRYRDLTLPDDDAGRADARVMVHHLPVCLVRIWLEAWTPWMDEDEIELLASEVEADRRYWKAAELGQAMRLTAAERAALKITTIQAIDPEETLRIKRDRKRQAEAARRRRLGAKPRDQYLADATASRPWEAQGISRRTWFRRREAGVTECGTGSVVDHLPSSLGGTHPGHPVPRRQPGIRWKRDVIPLPWRTADGQEATLWWPIDVPVIEGPAAGAWVH